MSGVGSRTGERGSSSTELGSISSTATSTPSKDGRPTRSRAGSRCSARSGTSPVRRPTATRPSSRSTDTSWVRCRARRSRTRLRQTAPAWWRRLVVGGLKFAEAHAQRDDAVACGGNLAVAALAEANARLCERGEWYLNEKDLLHRAGLDAVQPMMRALGSDLTGVVAQFGQALA